MISQLNTYSKPSHQDNFRSSQLKSTTKCTGDRFIPNRATTNHVNSFFISDSKSSLNSKPTSTPILVEDQANQSFTRLLEDALCKNLPQNFIKPSSPSSVSSIRSQMLAYGSKKGETLSSLNDSIQSTFKLALEVSNIQSTRIICPTPEKMLDAPEILDDYYLNLMDWSQSNILSIALNKNLYLWNYLTGSVQLLLSDPNEYISSVSFMKNGNCLGVGFANNSIQLWDIIKSLPLRSLPGHKKRVSSLSWNNHILSSGSRDAVIINHDVRMPENIISKYTGHSQEVCGLQWSLDGAQLASGSNDNNLIIWDQAMDSMREKFTEHKSAVKALAWSPWQKGVLASGGGTLDQCIKLWNCDTGKLMKSVQTESQVSSLIWNKFEKEILSSHGFDKNQLSLWKYPMMKKICELKGHMDRIVQMCESPDGEVVVSASVDETLRFWRVFQRNEKLEVKHEKPAVIFKNSNVNMR